MEEEEDCGLIGESCWVGDWVGGAVGGAIEDLNRPGFCAVFY